MPGGDVLVGRAGDLEAVRRLVANGRGVIVEGPAGIGKTRLIREVVVRLEPDPQFHVERVPATAASQPIPLGALAGHLIGVPPAADDIARVQQALMDRACGAILVIVADDAHLLDDVSAVAIHQLAVAGKARVLASVRKGAPTSSAVEALADTGMSERLVLPPLDEPLVAQMITDRLGGPVDAVLAHSAWVASRGNPMVVALLVDTGERTGTVAQKHGLWTATGALTADSRLLTLISEQLNQLSSAEKTAVEVIALTEPLEASIVEQMIPPAVIETLRRRGLVVGADGVTGTQLRLVHPLFGEAARLAISGPRRRAAISALAEAFDASDNSEAELLLRVAMWGAAAKCQLKPDLLMRAAAVARTRSLDSAAHLLRAALSVGAPPQASLDLAMVLTGQGRIDEAAAALADFGREELTPSERVSGCVTRAMGLVWTLQRPDLALTMIAEQRASGIGDPVLTGLLDGAEAAAYLINGDVRMAEEFGSRALTSPIEADEILVQSATVVCVARANGGRPQSGSEFSLLWEEAGQRVRSTAPHLAAGLKAARWSALELAGEIDTLAIESQVAFRKAIEEGDDSLRSRAAQSLARVALHGARPRRAVEFMREVLVGLSGFDRMFTGWNLALLAGTLAVAGDTKEARVALARCDEQDPIADIFASDRFRAEAALLASEGQVSKAAAVAASGARDAAAHGMVAQAAQCWFDAARFGHADASLELDRLSTVDGKCAPLWRNHARALLGHDAHALDASADAFAAIGALLWAAEAGMEAAMAHQRSGNPAKGVASVERAQSFIDPADPVSTPAMRCAGTVASHLTSREREVAHLAARGLADRAIAEKLDLSVRTVETHLARAYSKLGVPGRTELTSVFTEVPAR